MTSEDRSGPIQNMILNEISPESLMKHVREIFRHERVSGTIGEMRAADYIVDNLHTLGVSHEKHVFQAYLSYPKGAALRVIRPVRRSVHCVTLSFSGSTPPRGISGELVFAGRGEEKDYASVDVRGKIALIERVTAGVERTAEEHGAKGEIHVSGEKVANQDIATVFWGTPTPRWISLKPQIPWMIVGRDDGEYLKKLSSGRKTAVLMKTQIHTNWRKVPLIVATVPGNREPQKHVLVHSHLDSWFYGATDNATGNALLLELARVFSKHRSTLGRGVKFAWWPVIQQEDMPARHGTPIPSGGT